MTRFVLRLALPLLLLAAPAKLARADEPGAVVEPPPGTLVPAPDRPFLPLKVRPEPARTAVDVPVVPLAAAPPALIWYGWQVLATDAALAGLTAGCLAGGGDNFCSLPIVGYFVAGPLVHASHSRKRGVASLGMRAGFPVVGALIGAALSNCPPKEPNTLDLDFCGLDDVGIGFLSGMAVAIAIDSIWAFEDAAPTPSPTSPRRASWQVTPTLKVSDNSAGVGLAGRF